MINDVNICQSRFYRCLFVLFVLSCLVTSASMASPFVAKKLANKMQLVTMESHKVPLVTIVLAVKAGGMTETQETDGLTHLWEHMFFKGNSRLPNQEAFNKRIRELGITYNGDTSAEKVRYYFTLPSAYLEEGLQFMADAIMTPLLENDEISREIQVVLNEYDREASQPTFELYRLTNRIIYGRLDYLRDPLGQRDVITKANREVLLKMKNEVFVPSLSALLISGDFDSAKIEAQVNKYFKDWQDPAGWRTPKPLAFKPFPASDRLVMTHKETRNVSIAIRYEGPRAVLAPGDTFAADILISLLNLRSGRFYQKFIDSGLCLNAGLGYLTQSQAGELVLYANANPDKALKAEQALLQEPAEWLKKDYFTKEQLENVRRQLTVQHLFDLNRPSEYVKNLAFWWAITGLDYYDSYLENMAKVELKDIEAFVKKYLIKKSAITTVFLSDEDAKSIGLKDNSAEISKKYSGR